MVENPATWNEAEKIIEEVLCKHYENMQHPDPLIGFSLPKQIAEALRDAGLLND